MKPCQKILFLFFFFFFSFFTSFFNVMKRRRKDRQYSQWANNQTISLATSVICIVSSTSGSRFYHLLVELHIACTSFERLVSPTSKFIKSQEYPLG